MVNLLTREERKVLIERLVEAHRDKFDAGVAEVKSVRKLYSSWDDAKLLSVRFDEIN